MFEYLLQNDLDLLLSKKMLPVIYEHPKMDFDSVLTSIGFKRVNGGDILSKIPFLMKKFNETARSEDSADKLNWVMGELRKTALGNIPLKELFDHVKNENQ